MGSIIVSEAKIYPEIEFVEGNINLIEETELIDEIEEIELVEGNINLIEETEENNLKIIKNKFIDKLPEDIVIKIYKDYLEPELYYLQYKNIIESHESKMLNGDLLYAFIPTILAKPIVCKYISTKCSAFNYSFNKHKIKKEKLFRLILNGKSFVTVILFNIYQLK
jgi:hypothetical protein